MYLEILEKKGVKIKDLAVKRLARKLHQPRSMTEALITKEVKGDKLYQYLTMEYTFNGIKDIVNNFTDYDYFVNENEEKEFFEIDREWVSIVYSELSKVAKEEAENYKFFLNMFLDNSLAKYRFNRALEITDLDSDKRMDSKKDREKELRKIDARAKVIKDDFKRIFDNPIIEDELER